MIIDAQNHFIPAPYLDRLQGQRGLVTVAAANGGYRVHYASALSFFIDDQFLDVRRTLREMDAAGVDLALLSLHTPGPEQFPPEVGVPAARLANDCLAEVLAAHPARFIGLATLPLQDPSAALAELDRCVLELGLKGVQVFSNVMGAPIDSPPLLPFYDRVAELGVPLFLHPTYPVMADAMRDYYLIPTVGMMFDTSLAALRLILGGMMERLPALKVVLPHMGSTLPYLLGRVDHLSQARGRRLGHLSQRPSEYFKRFYVDTVNPSAPALRFGLEFVGVDRVLFGTDYPWHELKEYIELVKGLTLPAEEEQKIFAGNIISLLGLT